MHLFMKNLASRILRAFENAFLIASVMVTSLSRTLFVLVCSLRLLLTCQKYFSILQKRGQIKSSHHFPGRAILPMAIAV